MKPTIFQVTHQEVCEKVSNFIVPIQVGNRESFEDLRDNTADNIADKNQTYCELTALYWIWKNTNYRYIGICQYRRILLVKYRDITNILDSHDIIVPSSVTFRKSVKEQYISVHVKSDWDIMIDTLREMYPDYYNSSKKVFSNNKLYPYNMFITNRELLNKYCEWLFNLLFIIEKRVGDVSTRDTYNQRYIGFLSERLFTLYILHNKLQIEECPVIFEKVIQKENRVETIIKDVIHTLQLR